MRAIGLLVVIGLTSCTPDTVAEVPVCTCPVAAAGATARVGASAATTIGSTAPAVNATNAYIKVERGIAASVTSDNVTANNIKDVKRADKRARDALSTLVKQDGHPTEKAKNDARTTLDDLIKALESIR